MRKKNGDVWHLAQIIADDLEDGETGLSKPQRYKPAYMEYFFPKTFQA